MDNLIEPAISHALTCPVEKAGGHNVDEFNQWHKGIDSIVQTFPIIGTSELRGFTINSDGTAGGGSAIELAPVREQTSRSVTTLVNHCWMRIGGRKSHNEALRTIQSARVAYTRDTLESLLFWIGMVKVGGLAKRWMFPLDEIVSSVRQIDWMDADSFVATPIDFYWYPDDLITEAFTSADTPGNEHGELYFALSIALADAAVASSDNAACLMSRAAIAQGAAGFYDGFQCAHDETKEQASRQGKAAANARHVTNHAHRKAVEKHWMENRENYPSKDAAAFLMAANGIVPLAARTIREHLSKIRDTPQSVLVARQDIPPTE